MTLVKRLLAISVFSTERSLERMRYLTEAFSHPDRAFATIHIAGTNGKGSVCTKIAKTLELSGLKVGLYTSPHLFSYCERIVVQSQMVSEEEVEKELEEIFRFVDQAGLKPTFFELTTLLAFCLFKKHKVDVAVLETGLGGEFDATNVAHPQLSVITSINYDHEAILGSSLEEIAYAKAGIIKQEVPVVIGPKAQFDAIEKRAQDKCAPLWRCKEAGGNYDDENKEIAKLCFNVLKAHYTISDESIEKGCAWRPPCRLERKGDVIYDVAHNPAGFLRLFEALKDEYPQKKIRVILGLSKDKDLRSCLKIAATNASHIHLVEANCYKAASCQKLQSILAEEGYKEASFGKNLVETVQKAHLEATSQGELLVICGSFYIMPETKNVLEISSLPSLHLKG